MPFCHISNVFRCCVRGLPASWFLKVMQVCFFSRESVGRENNYMVVELSTWTQRAIFSCGL